MLVNACICLFFVASFCCIFCCIFLLHFFVAFVVFLHKICVSIMLFSDEVSNFGNRILTNKKHELVVSNFQWNCMLIPSLNFINFLNYFIIAFLTLFNFVTVPFLLKFSKSRWKHVFLHNQFFTNSFYKARFHKARKKPPSPYINNDNTNFINSIKITSN